MWFVGGIIGFILGVATGSGAAMFFFALFGGFIGYLIGSSKKKNGTAKETAITQQKQREPNDAMAEMRQRVAKLENRLQTLEQEIIQLKARGFVNATDETSNTQNQSIPEPVGDAPGATMAAASGPGLQVAATVPVPDKSDEQLDIVPPSVASEMPSLSEDLNTIPHDDLDLLSGSISPANVLPIENAPRIPTEVAVSNTLEVKRQPPPKSLRERLPAPLARLIFGGNALVKAGVLILFLGLAFLLRYTAERVTVPLELRYAGVALAGVVLLSLGWLLRNKRRDYGLILQGMAIGVFYLTTLSAIKLHALISPGAGFAFLFLVSILSAILAILQNAPMLAIVAALEGFATPVLASTGENRPVGLFTYLAVLDLGICLVAWFNAWRILNLIGFIGTFTLAFGWTKQYYTDEQYGTVQPFLIFFFILFALIGLFFARKTLQESLEQEGPLASLKRVGRVDSALVFGNPITAFGMQYMLVRHMEFGAAFSALAVGFFYLTLAKLVFSRVKQGLALLAEAYVIVAAIFATLAIPLGLEGTWTGAAWAIEGAGMYWLGIRQHRPYARGFAYVVMVGAAFKLLRGIDVNPEVGQPLLHGGWLGPVLLALSCFVVWNLHRRASQDKVASWELVPNAALPWLGVAAISLLPWMFLQPQFAAAALALMALLVSNVARRINVLSLTHISAALQVAGLGSFLLTLHAASAPDSHAALADGWHGGLAALIIAASILYSAGRFMVQAKRAAQAENLPPSWSLWNNMAVVSGGALVHLAMLFAVDLTQVAAIWPLTSCLSLWIALHMSHGALAVFAGGLQVVSAVLFMLEPGTFHGTAFAHLGFFVPLSLAFSAWLSGDRVRAEAVKVRYVVSLSADSQAGKVPAVWLNPWCNGKFALGLPILWGLVWWLIAWFPETIDTLERAGLREYSSAASVLIAVCSTVLMAVLTGWRNWPQMGMAAIVNLPLLVFAALIGMFGETGNYLPSAFLGWLAWPIALIWHLQLLKRQQAWIAGCPRLLNLIHLFGFWFFLLLAAREGEARLAPLADTWSSWALLGWVLIPALVFWLIGTKPLTSRWPLNTYRKTYIQHACAPVALYLLAWCWLTNAGSTGDASPLPYIPLLNPLELAQWLVLAALLHWLRALSPLVSGGNSKTFVNGVAAVTALALLTGMVLRGCHHFAGIPWDADALFASRLSQAAVSITWAICGVAVMLFGNRRMSRTVWIAGAALLGVVVVKLFLIELADQGGLYRIVSFIAVGILLLIVGYFAPVPVKPKSDTTDGMSENKEVTATRTIAEHEDKQ